MKSAPKELSMYHQHPVCILNNHKEIWKYTDASFSNCIYYSTSIADSGISFFLGKNSEIFTNFWFGAFPACGTKQKFTEELDIWCFWHWFNWHSPNQKLVSHWDKAENIRSSKIDQMKIKTEEFGVMSWGKCSSEQEHRICLKQYLL